MATNNSISTILEQLFSTNVQNITKKALVGEQICGKEAHAALQKGAEKWNFPYESRGTLQSYTPGTGVTKKYFKGTNEYMQLNDFKVFNIVLDNVEMRQHLRRAQILAQKVNEATEEINVYLDSLVMGEYENATYKYGSGGITTSTTVAGKTFTAGNISPALGTVFANLQDRLGSMRSKFLVLPYFLMDRLADAAISNAFNMADAAMKNGYVGNHKGFKLYVSTNLTSEIVLTVGTGTIAEGDYIQIKNTTLTLKDTLTANGELHVCDTVAHNCTNIAAALNAPGTDIAEAAGTGYQAYDDVDGDQLWELYGLEATATSTTVTIKSTRGIMNVQSSFADSKISFGTEVVHCLAGEEGAIQLAYQEKGKVEYNGSPVDSSGRTMLAKEYNYLLMAGVKTFFDGKRRLVDVQANVA